MKILLVDDHAPIRRGLRQLIERRDEFEIVGEGENGIQAVERATELHPDIVLMDMNMPVMNGAEATRQIKEQHPDIKVLALTAFADMSLVSAMVKAGASGYLLKGGSSSELLESLEAVATGHGALGKEVAGGVLEDMAELYRKEQERADALAELDRMKSEFISVVSHELRTPLTAIKGGISTLRTGWTSIDDSARLEFFDAISRQCDRLSRMIGQILTVSGIQRGSLGFHVSTFSLDTVVWDAMKIATPLTKGRDVDVDLTETRAWGDPEHAREIAVALIDNALKFTSGKVRVETSLHGSKPQLRVFDEGPGLDEKTLREVLEEPFKQADSSNTRPVGGLGLSLYIARQVLRASGGTLEVETGPDRGSVFTASFPAPR